MFCTNENEIATILELSLIFSYARLMLISIIIPTHNRLGMVLRAIDSVLNQSYKNFELIVVDDGSTDQTSEFIKRYPDPRLKYYQISHGGVAKARNYGVEKSESDWICFLDSDDVWRRHKLSEQLRYHDKNRDILISQTEDVWIRNSVRVNKMKKHMTREGDIFKESLSLCLICCSSVMINKKLFYDMGGFDETLKTCEDYDLWLRITAKHRIGFIPRPLVTKFGGHDDQLSKIFPIMDQYRIYALEKLLKTFPLTAAQRQLTEEERDVKKRIVEEGKKKRTTFKQ